MIGILAAGAGLAATLCGLYGIPVLVRRCEVEQLRTRVLQTRSLVLTYDDGPGAHLTQSLRSLLAEHNAKATFFLLGSKAAASPEIISQLQADGHDLGCHTLNHCHAWRTPPWRTLSDMKSGYLSMQRWLTPNALFRPPYGKILLPTLWALRFRGASIGWWTVDSGDTHRDLPTPQSVVDTVQRAGGGVVLMHDFDRNDQKQERAAFVLRTTEMLLQTARREGMNVCRYSDLSKVPAQQSARVVAS